jgi:replication factor A1
MSQDQKIGQLLTEVLEVKSALTNITELLTEQRDGLAAFGKALQDCVEILQPTGYPLRNNTTSQQPQTTPDQPPTPAPQQPATQPKMSEPAPVVIVKSGQQRIGELKDGDKKVTVTGKVIIVNAERKTSTGKRVTECVIGDDSGTIRLSLWETQIDLVKEGNVVTVEKGYVTSFQEKAVLNVGQWGTLKVETPP